MTKKLADEARQRRIYAPRGERSQKRLTFLIDLDNYAKIADKPNKGRYINDAIRAYI